MKPNFKRILLKVSGQFLSKGVKGGGLDQPSVESVVKRIIAVHKRGVEVGVVVGGGNLFRGRDSAEAGFKFEKIESDKIGMLATVMNSLILKNSILLNGDKAAVFSAVPMLSIVEGINHEAVMKCFETGYIVIFACGTGNPFFSTDSAAALRAAEIKAELLIKATRVDGVFSGDPEIDKTAKKFERLSYDEVLAKNLKVMDSEAFALCKNQKIPIAVININQPDSLERLIAGERVGSLICD